MLEQDTQIRAIREFADLGVDLFILHTIIGMEKNNPTELGLERYAKIFDEAENRLHAQKAVLVKCLGDK